jgi:ABC-type transport system involved in Fe-S cluster assembly fused permease/ATPase subunit
LEKQPQPLVSGGGGIVVAHRLTHAQSCHRIAVMNDGIIEALGTHDKLIKHGSRSAELWTAWSRP